MYVLAYASGINMSAFRLLVNARWKNMGWLYHLADDSSNNEQQIVVIRHWEWLYLYAIRVSRYW